MSGLVEDGSDIPPPEPGKTSVRMGPAYLQWVDKEHLGLFRPLTFVRNDGGEIKQEVVKPLGPLGIYRRAGRNETVAMKTSDPRTGEPIDLVLVWKPGK